MLLIVNRRKFLSLGGLAISASLIKTTTLAQDDQSSSDTTIAGPIHTVDMSDMEFTIEEVENLDNLNPVLQENLGIDFSVFENSDQIIIDAPEFAESGASVPVAVEVSLPIEEVKAIHIFVDQNPLPHIMTAKLGPKSGQPSFSTKIRVSDVSPVRAVAETVDGKYLLASQVIVVAAGGCG